MHHPPQLFRNLQSLKFYPDPFLACLSRMLRHLKLVSGEAYGLRVSGEIYLYLDNPQQALFYLQQSLNIEEEVLHGTKDYIGLAYEQQGKQFIAHAKPIEASNNFLEAQKSIFKAKTLFTELNAISNFGTILEDSARIDAKYAACEVLNEISPDGSAR